LTKCSTCFPVLLRRAMPGTQSSQVLSLLWLLCPLEFCFQIILAIWFHWCNRSLAGWPGEECWTSVDFNFSAGKYSWLLYLWVPHP
jgi:hypothetical protein